MEQDIEHIKTFSSKKSNFSKKEILSLIVFIVSLFLVFTIIISQIQNEVVVIIDGEHQIIESIPSNYSLLSVLFIIFFTILTTLSGFYFMNDMSKQLQLNSKQKVQLQLLEKDEKEVYMFIIQEGSVLQKDIVLELGINKVKVTRILDKLERRGVIQRLSYGNTNKIVVK
ncbi:MAG: helix-turn-helix transcriptional regulator [Candidatus Woesearchaeota archaeon]